MEKRVRMLGRRARPTVVWIAAVACAAGLFAVDAGLGGGAALAAARAPELPRKKRTGLFNWPRVRSSPSTPDSRPEDENGRFITKSRICRTVGGRQVCYDVYRVRSRRGRSYMIEREDLWRR